MLILYLAGCWHCGRCSGLHFEKGDIANLKIPHKFIGGISFIYCGLNLVRFDSISHEFSFISIPVFHFYLSILFIRTGKCKIVVKVLKSKFHAFIFNRFFTIVVIKVHTTQSMYRPPIRQNQNPTDSWIYLIIPKIK